VHRTARTHATRSEGRSHLLSLANTAPNGLPAIRCSQPLMGAGEFVAQA
jgi:hypothetical protein